MNNLFKLSIIALALGALSCQNEESVDQVTNQPPKATNVKITGEANIGEVLSTTYTYQDAESDKEKNSIISWLSSNTKDGSNPTEVSVAQTYALTKEDEGKYVAVKVTPKQSDGKSGTAITSSFIGPITSKTSDAGDDQNTNSNKVAIGDKTLNIVSALILDSKGQNNLHSDKHYEYVVTLGDGENTSGVTYKNGRYTITAELHSPGTQEFGFGKFNHCVLADCEEGIDNKAFVSHVFIVEDTNDDDIIDFNTSDPSINGTGKGSVSFIKVENDIYTISYDIELESKEKLTGSYTGKFVLE